MDLVLMNYRQFYDRLQESKNIKRFKSYKRNCWLTLKSLILINLKIHVGFAHSQVHGDIPFKRSSSQKCDTHINTGCILQSFF